MTGISLPCGILLLPCRNRTVSSPSASFLNINEIPDPEFIGYMAKFSKNYATAEERKNRESIFLAKKALIDAHNARTDVSFKLGLNKFADYTKEEYMKLLGYAGVPNHATKRVLYHPLPKSTGLDWRLRKNVIGSVKDQGQNP